MDSAQIPLYRAGDIVAYTAVDADDLAFVQRWRWFLLPKGYAVRNTRAEGIVYLHRALLGLVRGDPRHCDHINRDRLDNRRSNLRIATAGENRQNVGATGGYSRFRGVTYHKGERKWQAQAQLGGKHTTIGRYATEVEAAEAAAEWRREHMPFSAEALAAPLPKEMP